MSENEKGKRKPPRKASEAESPASKAAGSPGPGPMGTGDPDAGESGPMGTEDAHLNKDAMSHDTADEGEGKAD